MNKDQEPPKGLVFDELWTDDGEPVSKLTITKFFANFVDECEKEPPKAPLWMSDKIKVKRPPPEFV